MASQYCKDFVFENVRMNRIDAHQVIYNLTVRNSYLGYRGFTLTGQGTLIIENTTVESEYFINLRSDYGSTWNGDVYISNCTHKHQSNYMFKFINFSISLDNGELHDFGYEVHQPNIYIENFTIDCINKPDIKCYPIIANFTNHNFEKANDDYWSKNIYINGYEIINSSYEEPYISFYYTNSDKINNNFFLTNTKIKVGNEDYTNKFNIGETFSSTEDVEIKIEKNLSANNTITIYKDGDILLNNFTIAENYSSTLTENGNYKIVLTSVDNHFSKTGEKVYEFKIEKAVFNDEVIINNNYLNIKIILLVALSSISVLVFAVIVFCFKKRR